MRCLQGAKRIPLTILGVTFSAFFLSVGQSLAQLPDNEVTDFDNEVTDFDNEVTDFDNEVTDLALSIVTDQLRYYPGQDIVVTGIVGNSNGDLPDQKVLLEYSNTDDNEVIHRTSQFTDSSGYFENGEANAVKPGKYRVVATVNIGGETETAYTNFSVIDYYINIPFAFMIWGLASFAGMIMLLLRPAKDPKFIKVLPLVCLSGITLAVIGTFLLTDVEVGANSSIGLVTKGNATNQEWVINVGGSIANDYSSGVQIPVYVFVFGIVGGYLRYLYDISRTSLSVGAGSSSSGTGIPPEQKALGDLATILLAPLLAIALWFILNQSGIESASGKYTIVAVSFAVGLVTDEVVGMITRFARQVVGAVGKEGTGEAGSPPQERSGSQGGEGNGGPKPSVGV